LPRIRLRVASLGEPYLAIGMLFKIKKLCAASIPRKWDLQVARFTVLRGNLSGAGWLQGPANTGDIWINSVNDLPVRRWTVGRGTVLGEGLEKVPPLEVLQLKSSNISR
jgi:hypothetical protein